MPKRKREKQPSRKKKAAKKKAGPIRKKIKKTLNEKQRSCFKVLRQCIKEFQEIEQDAAILEEPSFLQSVGNGIVKGAKGLLSVAAEIAVDPDVKLAAERALKAFLKATNKIPATRPSLGGVSISELIEGQKPEPLLLLGNGE